MVAQILNPSTQETESGRSVICEFQASLFYANDLQASLLQRRGGGGRKKNPQNHMLVSEENEQYHCNDLL